MFGYINLHNIQLPRNYAYFDSSMDCLHCTGFLAENRGKLEYLRRHYPTAAAEVATRLRYIRSSVRAELKHIEQTLEAYG